MKTAIGYIRVSTQGQAVEGVSLEAQKAKIAAWCELNDYTLVEVFTDAGLSGKSMTGREGLQAALKATGKDMALVTYSISRLARSTKDMIAIAERLKKAGADLVSLTEKIDTTTATGRMVFRLLASLAEFEREQIGERTKAALAHLKAQGEVYGTVPFGYRAVERRLVEVKAEARVVADICRMRDSGAALRDIARHLNDSGIASKRGGQWYASTVRYVINRQAA